MQVQAQLTDDDEAVIRLPRTVSKLAVRHTLRHDSQSYRLRRLRNPKVLSTELAVKGETPLRGSSREAILDVLTLCNMSLQPIWGIHMRAGFTALAQWKLSIRSLTFNQCGLNLLPSAAMIYSSHT